MRKIKYLILIIALLVGFVCETEIFQFELYNFADAYFRGSSFKVYNEEQRIELLKRVEELANENQVGIFLKEMQQKDMHNNELHIFSNAIAKKEIIEQTNIKQEKYKSLMNGNTEVFYYDFAKAQEYENRYINSIYFTGNKSDIVNLYNQIKNEYKILYPEIAGCSEEDVMYAVFGLISILMVVLTIISVFYSKKEVMVRISFGEDVRKIIVVNMFCEIVVSLLLFFIIKNVVFQFLSGQFMEDKIFLVYLTGVLLSCLMYGSYAFYDVRLVFANGNNTGAMLGGLYVTKVVIALITIIGIGTNFTIIKENNNFLDNDKYLEKYEGYSYLYIKDRMNFISELVSQEELDEEEKRSETKIPKMVRQLYKKYYDEAAPLLCVNVLEDTSSYIMANENAAPLVEDFIDMKGYQEDILIIIPENANETYVIEEANAEIGFMVKNTQNITKKVVKYDGYKNFTYINKSSEIGMQTVVNPVIIYIQNRELSENLHISEYAQDILFKLDSKQIEQIKMDLGLEENGYKLIVSDYKDNYEYYQGFVKKLIGFLSSVSMFLFILLMVLITIITTLEYQINAMKLAIKKVVGYSLFEKNKRTLILCVGIDLIIAICAICYRICNGKMTAVTSTAQVALIVTVLELAVCLINIYRIEKKSIVKILKGGCL